MRFVIVIPSSLILLATIFIIGSTRKTPRAHFVYPSPNTAEAFLKRGKLYEKEGNYEQALSDYVQAEKLAPNDRSVYLNQGSVLSTLKQPDAAIKQYLIVKEMDQQNDLRTDVIDYLIDKEREKL